MGLFSKYLSSWVLAAILSGERDAMVMWRDVHKQHLEVFGCSQIQSAYINAKPNRGNLHLIVLCLCLFLSFITFLSHYFSVFFLFMCVYIYIWMCDSVCGCDSVIVDRMITGLSLFSPEKTHLFKVTQSSQTRSPPFSNKVYYVSAVPYRSDDNHSGTMKAATSESFGPRDAPTSKLTNRCTATKSHGGACSLSLHRKR